MVNKRDNRQRDRQHDCHTNRSRRWPPRVYTTRNCRHNDRLVYSHYYQFQRRPISGIFRISQRGGPTQPTLPLPPPFPPLPTFHPFASLPGGPLPTNTARGSGGALKLPQRVRAEPGPPPARRFLVHFRLKGTLLVTFATFAVLKRESSSLKKSWRSGQGGGPRTRPPPKYATATNDSWLKNQKSTNSK